MLPEPAPGAGVLEYEHTYIRISLESSFNQPEALDSPSFQCEVAYSVFCKRNLHASHACCPPALIDLFDINLYSIE